MLKAKKYDYRVVKNRKNWKAEIIRRATSSKTVVSKRQAGFLTEAEATEWAEKELKLFLDNQAEKNKRHCKQRELRDENEQEKQEQERLAREVYEKKETGTS